MPVSNEYEFIAYQDTNFLFKVGCMDYFRPHFHREMEVLLILRGDFAITAGGETIVFRQGDFCIIDPCRIHETRSLSANSRTIFLSLQLRSDFCKAYYPELENISFPFMPLNPGTLGVHEYSVLFQDYVHAGLSYFRKSPGYQLQTTGLINLFFYRLLKNVPHQPVPKEAQEDTLQRTARLKELTDYIGKHYSETLFLTDVAEVFGLSMSRLSHVFREHFGLSFQEYLARVRCEEAAEYLRNTDMKLLDISLSCGFSDPKYFNQAFQKMFLCTPKEYRKGHKEIYQDDAARRNRLFDDSDVEFSAETSREVLEYCEEVLLNKVLNRFAAAEDPNL